MEGRWGWGLKWEYEEEMLKIAYTREWKKQKECNLTSGTLVCSNGLLNWTNTGRRAEWGIEAVHDKQLYKGKEVKEKGKRQGLKEKEGGNEERRWKSKGTRRRIYRKGRDAEYRGESRRRTASGMCGGLLSVHWAAAVLCCEVSLVPHKENTIVWIIDDTTCTHSAYLFPCVIIVWLLFPF